MGVVEVGQQGVARVEEVEQGNHAELLTRGGAYARLHGAQFAGAAVEVE